MGRSLKLLTIWTFDAHSLKIDNKGMANWNKLQVKTRSDRPLQVQWNNDPRNRWNPKKLHRYWLRKPSTHSELIQYRYASFSYASGVYKKSLEKLSESLGIKVEKENSPLNITIIPQMFGVYPRWPWKSYPNRTRILPNTKRNHVTYQ